MATAPNIVAKSSFRPLARKKALKTSSSAGASRSPRSPKALRPTPYTKRGRSISRRPSATTMRRSLEPTKSAMAEPPSTKAISRPALRTKRISTSLPVGTNPWKTSLKTRRSTLSLTRTAPIVPLPSKIAMARFWRPRRFLSAAKSSIRARRRPKNRPNNTITSLMVGTAISTASN